MNDTINEVRIHVDHYEAFKKFMLDYKDKFKINDLNEYCTGGESFNYFILTKKYCTPIFPTKNAINQYKPFVESIDDIFKLFEFKNKKDKENGNDTGKNENTDTFNGILKSSIFKVFDSFTILIDKIKKIVR